MKRNIYSITKGTATEQNGKIYVAVPYEPRKYHHKPFQQYAL